MNKTVCALYTLLKVYVAVLQRVIENSIILFFGKTKLNKTFSCPSYLKEECLNIQKEFVKIFNNYDVCNSCVSHCCHSKINRFDFVDCYLNNFVLKEGLSHWHKISHLMSAFFELFYSVRKIRKNEPPSENCIHFSASSGCVLPIGNRPGMCIAGACYKLLRSFSIDDLRNYCSLLSKYMSFHFKCSFYLTKNLLVCKEI